MQPVERARETRLGIVMYGGVSLAIYINGVAQELFRAVQGEGIYTLLKICLDTDIIVDIISGTSAGGINGILLGYALANVREFSTTKDLWRTQGDISLLFNSPNADPTTCRSLLDSDEFYRTKLAEAFQKLDGKPYVSTQGLPSLFQEMDIFITGTSVTPDLYTTFDDAGRAIEMQDYRKLFKLKHRAGRSNPGAFICGDREKPIRFQALAKLARITSCFPGAFSPVRVLSAEHWKARNPGNEPPQICDFEDKVDAILSEWGQLRNSAYFLDGGVLDNKPFTPTIEAIFKRPADRPVDRILFYVEPDPENCELSSRIPDPPSFFSAVMEGMIGISTYQSTTDDAKAIEDHNTRVVRHTAICQELIGKIEANDAKGVGVPATVKEPQRTLYISSRNTQLASRALKGLLRDSETGDEVHFTSSAERERAKNLFHSLNVRDKGELSFEQTFERFDIYFRQRRLVHVVRRLYIEQARALGSQDAGFVQKLLRGLNCHIQLLDIVQYWFEYALDHIPVDWRAAQGTADPSSTIWNSVNTFLSRILTVPPKDQPTWLPSSTPGTPSWLSTADLDRVNSGLGAKIKQSLKETIPNNVASGSEEFVGILQWTDSKEIAFWDAVAGESMIYKMAREEYDHYVCLDAIIFPLDFISTLTNLEEIRLLRISPEPTVDDQGHGFVGFKAESGAEQKLAGRSLAHFGGFLKRSWRSNDIMWGRLDTLRHVVIALLTKDAIARLRADAARCALILNSLGGIEGLRQRIDKLFPESPPRSRVQLGDFLGSLLRAQGITFNLDELDGNLNLLVEMGQLEIIRDELPGVFRDAALQQSTWNQYASYPQRSPTTSTKSAFESPDAYVDPLLVGFEIERKLARIGQVWTDGIAAATEPKTTPLGRYFENTYDLATEGMERGIPPLIVARYISHATLVLNACLLGSLPSNLRAKVEANPVYKLVVRLPLRTSYRIVNLWLMEPRSTSIMLTAALVSSAVAFVCTIVGLVHPAKETIGVVLGISIGIFLISLLLLAHKVNFLGTGE